MHASWITLKYFFILLAISSSSWELLTAIILWICDVSNKTLEVTQWSGLLLNMGKEYEEHKEAEYKKNAALEKRDSSGFCLHIYVK